MSNIKANPEEVQRLYEEFVNDENLKLFHKQKAYIIERSVPKYYIMMSDKIDIVYDEQITNLLHKIDQTIYSYIRSNYPQLAK